MVHPPEHAKWWLDSSGFRQVWAEHIEDPSVLNTISQGHRCTFLSWPHDSFSPTLCPQSDSKSSLLLSSYSKSSASRDYPSSTAGQFLRRIFFSLSGVQENRWFQASHSLSALNLFIRKDHFKMEPLQTIHQAVLPNDCLISVDLKDTNFFHAYL